MPNHHRHPSTHNWYHHYSPEEIEQEVLIQEWRYPDKPNARLRAHQNLIYNYIKEKKQQYNDRKVIQASPEAFEESYDKIDLKMSETEAIINPTTRAAKALSYYQRYLALQVYQHGIARTCSLLGLSVSTIYNQLPGLSFPQFTTD